MNILIRLIMDIIEAVYERESRERERLQTAPQAPVARKNEGARQPLPPQGRSDMVASQDVRQALHDVFNQFQGGAQPPPVPQPRPKARKRRSEEKVESLGEHIAQNEAYLADLDRRAQSNDDHTREHLGVQEENRELAAANFVIPGNTPIERMILAGVILGPCKAQHARRLL
jgi:hypothetical protein